MNASAPSSNGLTDPRVVVLQVGARLHYGVPAAYARHGALTALYTDAVADKGVLRLGRRLWPQPLRPRVVRRLLGRTLPADIPPNVVETAAGWTLLERAALSVRLQSEAVTSTHQRLRDRLMAADFRGANCLYSVDNGDLSLLRAAKDRGLKVIYEQIINPSVGRILREERNRHPGVEPQDSDELVERGIAIDKQVFALADAVVCASDFVRDDIRAVGSEVGNVHVVPYGIEEGWLAAPSSPVPGQVLFVGTIGLRKGVHHLAEATRSLRARGVRCDVRVIGPMTAGHARHPMFSGPEYLGQVPRSEIRRHFANADVFVLPTLAESFGLVHLEAMAMGVPVITTPNCGSVVRDGVDGFIVPIRDPAALAERIEQLVTDRSLRERMSSNARARAAEFTWSRFSELLMNATRAALSAAATTT